MPFRRLRLLGSGAHGSAHLVEHKGSGALLVMKKILAFDRMPASDREQALQEADLLARLAHPCIVRYSSSFVEHGALHIVMEYCEGGDLSQRISEARDAGRALGEELALDWFAQLVLAVAFAHSRRVLHRDVKPSNVFLMRDGSVRLGDFGVARVLERASDLALTVIGTPFMLSPELCQNAPYSYKSDMWALGCVLFELVSLAHPYKSDNIFGLAQKIVCEAHEPMPPTVSPDVVALVDRLLAKDPDARPSADELLSLPLISRRFERLGLQAQLQKQLQTQLPPATLLSRPLEASPRSSDGEGRTHAAIVPPAATAPAPPLPVEPSPPAMSAHAPPLVLGSSALGSGAESMSPDAGSVSGGRGGGESRGLASVAGVAACSPTAHDIDASGGSSPSPASSRDGRTWVGEGVPPSLRLPPLPGVHAFAASDARGGGGGGSVIVVGRGGALRPITVRACDESPVGRNSDGGSGGGASDGGNGDGSVIMPASRPSLAPIRAPPRQWTPPPSVSSTPTARHATLPSPGSGDAGMGAAAQQQVPLQRRTASSSSAAQDVGGHSPRAQAVGKPVPPRTLPPLSVLAPIRAPQGATPRDAFAERTPPPPHAAADDGAQRGTRRTGDMAASGAESARASPLALYRSASASDDADTSPPSAPPSASASRLVLPLRHLALADQGLQGQVDTRGGGGSGPREPEAFAGAVGSPLSPATAPAALAPRCRVASADAGHAPIAPLLRAASMPPVPCAQPPHSS